MNLAVTPDIKRKVEKAFATTPGLADRVRTISDEMRVRFGGAESKIDSFEFEAGDPPITLVVHADFPEEEFWDRYDVFVDFLAERRWISDSVLGVHVFYAGPMDE